MTNVGDKCWRQMLVTNVGDKCWRQMLVTDVVDKCWRLNVEVTIRATGAYFEEAK